VPGPTWSPLTPPRRLSLVELNARENGIHLETERVDWAAPDALVERSPFDLVLAADVLYERSSVGLLLSLLPRLGNEVWIASPDRAMAEAFVTQAQREWCVETEVRGVVRIHRLGRHCSRDLAEHQGSRTPVLAGDRRPRYDRLPRLARAGGKQDSGGVRERGVSWRLAFPYS
jgi:hypothetical protein